MPRRPRQLRLDEARYHTGRGGPRRGAGRPPKAGRSIVHHIRRDPIRKGCPAHVTVRVRSDVPKLRSKRFLKAFRKTLRAGCDQGHFRVVHYSVQGDHIHLFVEASGKPSLGRGMQSISLRISRAVNRVFSRKGPVLLGRYHVRALGNPKEVRNALRYVLLNARGHYRKRHPRAAMPAPGLDAASSGRWFDGWRRTPWPEPKADIKEVAEARFWLSTVGWRKHHPRIDPSEVPSRA